MKSNSILLHTLTKTLSILICLLSGLAHADMFVDRSVVIFEKDSQSREDIKVSNSGDDNIYAQVDVLLVRNPGEANEERLKITDPEKLNIIATPNKLIIPPGGQKLVRIVRLKQGHAKEQVYRINITPILPPLAEENSQLRIVVAYQILTILQARDPKTSLIVTRQNEAITFKNEGNSNLLLAEGKQCHPKDARNCVELTSKRLYAGNSWTLQLPFDAPVSYSVRSFDGIKQQLYP